MGEGDGAGCDGGRSEGTTGPGGSNVQGLR